MISYGGCTVEIPFPELEGQAFGEVARFLEKYVSENLISAVCLCFHYQLHLYTLLSFYCVPVEMPA